MSCIFFYGLFMDANLLRGMGLHPKLIGPAELPGYQIHIGNRATLIANRGSTSYGMLIELPDEDAIALYSAPDVSDYRPETVNAILLNDGTIRPSLCYNLPANEVGAGINSEYAQRLSELVLENGFPPAYASEITKRRTMRRLVSSGSPLEPRIGFSRAVRVGSFLAIAGTAPIAPDGGVASPGDVYGQTKRCLEIITQAIADAGLTLESVVRTRVMLTDISRWDEAARAHGETFAGIKPACTFVEVKGFVNREWLVELEADCVADTGA